MDKRGMNVPEASGGRGMGFLAGLGKLVTDHFSGQRERMLQQQKDVDRRALDLVTKAAGYDIEREAAIAAAPLMKAQNFAKIGNIEKQREAKITYSDKPDTKGKEGTPSNTQPTTEDTGPTSSTSDMKGPKIKKQTVSTRPSSGRTKKPYVTKAEVTAAVKGGHIQEAEGLGLNKAYDSMVARREDSAGKMDTKPKVKKTKNNSPSLPRKASGKVGPAQAEAEAWPGAGPRFGGDGKNVIKPKNKNTPKVGDTVTKGGGITEITPAKVKTGKRGSGNSASTNGNKKGGM